jgi:hypothetical protein
MSLQTKMSFLRFSVCAAAFMLLLAACDYGVVGGADETVPAEIAEDPAALE